MVLSTILTWPFSWTIGSRIAPRGSNPDRPILVFPPHGHL
jgi:hypothetical protein